MEETISFLPARLAETATWCESRVGDSRVGDSSPSLLRSPQLQPSISFFITHSDGAVLAQPREVQGWHLETVNPDGRKKAVDELVHKRHQLLRQEGTKMDDPTQNRRNGRLLLYNPNLNHLYSGLPEEASSGFFEIDNSPPWDTWVAYIQQRETIDWPDFLLCWIPAPYIALANAGVVVDAELDRCIVWADEVELPFIRRMRMSGLFD